MITYIIHLDGQFVLGHADALPMEKITAMLKSEFGETVEFDREEFDRVIVEFQGEIDRDVLFGKVEALLEAEYPDGKSSGLEVSVCEPLKDDDGDKDDGKADGEKPDGDRDEGPEKTEEQAATREQHEQKQSGGSFSELLSDHKGASDKSTETVETVMKRINMLVAAHDFKQLACEISAIAPSLLSGKMTDVIANRSYLFSVNDGYGLTTCLGLFADLLAATGLMRMAQNPVIEIKLGAVKAEDEAFTAARKILEVNRNDVRVLCIDISEWMNDTESALFKKFLRELDDCRDRYVIVFRLPFVDKYVLEKVRYSLNDLCFVSAVSFPPFSADELRQCAAIHLGKYGLSMTPAAWKAFDKRVVEERSDGKFYGLRTVKKVMMELIYDKLVNNFERGKSDAKIDAKTASALCLKPISADRSGFEMLNNLVGSQAIVDKVNEIVAQIELAVSSGGERPCIHMRFVGNPGTGKTTVARILGKILKEKGILRVGEFHECRGRDLCGMYVGTTAPKTASICRDAYGSVLFIDEAYSLYRGGSINDYGREALDTLIAEMENHRTDFVVIMAGYTDEMKTLMEGNSGLASRMPYMIEFPNFTRDQLFDIYKSMLDGANYRADQKCLDAVRGYIDKLPDDYIASKEFSNARFVRNLFERTTAKAALRLQLEGKPIAGSRLVLTKDDFDRAISDGEFKIENTSQHKIGFKPIG